MGEGGSARVFAAQDLKHGRRVAIKILKTEIMPSIAADRFLREIRIDAALQHPRIVPLFDSGEVLESPYFVMPFIEGTTLRDRIHDGPLGLADTIRIASQIAEALQYLHTRGLVHRDVKPENILLQGEHVWLADLGIVRALRESAVIADSERVTATGTAVGTVAYMSPEQRLGLESIDGRSDQFSLGCVIYEMLVGHPPKMSDRSHMRATPNGPGLAPVSATRRDVSPALDDVLSRALELNEEDRWPSMQAFATKLRDPSAATPQSVPVLEARRSNRMLVPIAMIAAFAAGVGWYVTREPAPELDPLTVAVLPLAHEGDSISSNGFLDGDDCSRYLRDAIGRWTGIRHVDDMQLRDVRKRFGRPETLERAMHMAQVMHAGRAVWGVVGPGNANNSTRTVRLFLYNVATKARENEVDGVVATNAELSTVFQQFADSLLSGIAGAVPGVGLTGTRDLNAARAYLAGHRALNNFNLAGAATAFRTAVEADPRFGLAFLWLAWSTLWTPESNPREWGAAASRALAVGAGLSGRDSVHARALVFMNDKKFVEACDLLRELTVSNPDDFAAWYGLGECLSSDFAVIPSDVSPSRWKFRTSMAEAINAYERAIDLVPSYSDAMGQRAIQRISRWLFAQQGRYRAGISADSQRFAAWPSLNADTIAFIPFAERAVFADSAGTRDASYQQALELNRLHVLALVNRWANLDTLNPVALEALAIARENNDELLTVRRVETGARISGLSALRLARRMSTGEDAIRLAATEVRFLIKTDRYTESKRLADSLLAAVSIDSAGPFTAASMQSLAMLTGRVDLAREWGHRSASFTYSDPLNTNDIASAELSQAASDAAVFSSMGVETDSLRAALARVERAISRSLTSNAELQRQLFVEQPLIYAWPTLGPAVDPPTRASAGNRWLTIQLALARRDTASARRSMLSADSAAARNGVNVIAFEIALANARIWLALGDTTNALRAISASSDLVRTSGDQLITRPTATASFVRGLILRSELAAARSDSLQSRYWGTRALALWGDGDSMNAGAIQPVLRWRGVPIPTGSR